ncbi:MAG: hypothetical protein KYX69_13570 [Sphingomonas sp.]|uniref:hypothetical protein n=1 Tax=Sphingomonas sp. TaxID=28214 RepID=UPI00262AE601|nr:hypothetical protein [Sphingomonas sp.]MDK2768734.1 hypothetical protein [Sphingomonas sp.]
MNVDFTVISGAAFNMIILGPIIWGGLSRSEYHRSRIWMAVGLPASINLLFLVFRSDFSLEDRLAGLAVTLSLAALGLAVSRRLDKRESR